MNMFLKIFLIDEYDVSCVRHKFIYDICMEIDRVNEI